MLDLHFSEKVAIEYLVAKRLRVLSKRKEKNGGLSVDQAVEYGDLKSAYEKLLNN